MAKGRKAKKRAAAPPPPPDSGELYMLSRRAGARPGADGVTVANLATGARILLPADAIHLIEAFLGPAPIADALRACTNGAPAAMMAAAGQVADLIALDVLVPAAEESGPGPAPAELPGGWAAAAQFIARTRTSAEVHYLDSQEMSELLWIHLTSGRQPSCFCDRPEAPFLALPDPPLEKGEGWPADDVGLVATLLKRRTTRRFDDRPMPAEMLGRLLRLVWGATDRVDNPLGDYFLRKTSPSGGALHPVEVYPIVRNVAGIAPGAYHYSVRRHGLELVSDAPPDDWIVAAAGDQYWLGECAVVFLSTAFLPRMAWKYNFSRAFRAVLADAGHLGQTLALLATAMGLGAFTTIALRDEIFEDRLGLDPLLEPPVLLNGIGFLEPDGADRTRPRFESLE